MESPSGRTKIYKVKNKSMETIDNIKFFNQRKLDAAKRTAKSQDLADILAEYEKLAGYYEEIPKEKKVVKKATKKRAKKKA